MDYLVRDVERMNNTLCSHEFPISCNMTDYMSLVSELTFSVILTYQDLPCVRLTYFLVSLVQNYRPTSYVSGTNIKTES